MPWDLAHTRTAVEPAGPPPALRPLRPGRREPAGARRAESTYLARALRNAAAFFALRSIS